MFVKISHSRAGSLIISDFTLLGTHFLFGKWGPLLVSFFFLSMSPEFRTTLLALRMIGGGGEERKEKRAETGSSKQSQHDQSCWVEENSVYNDWRGAGGGHCSETDHLNTKFLWHCSSKDRMGDFSYINHTITTMLMSNNSFRAYFVCSKPGFERCNCIIIKHQPLFLQLSYYYLRRDSRPQQQQQQNRS